MNEKPPRGAERLYHHWSDGALVRATTADKEGYEQWALALMAQELFQRGMTPENIEKSIIEQVKSEQRLIRVSRYARPLRFTAVAVPVIGIAARLHAGGWFILALGFFYLVFTGFHLLVHLRIAKRVAERGGWPLMIVIASHVALLLAFLFQLDAGDGPGLIYGVGYDAVRPPSWLPRGPSGIGSFDFELFVPWFFSTVFLFLWSFSRSSSDLGSTGNEEPLRVDIP